MILELFCLWEKLQIQKTNKKGTGKGEQGVRVSGFFSIFIVLTNPVRIAIYVNQNSKSEHD